MVPLGDITEAHFDGIFNTNVKGVLFTVQKALPLLKDGSPVILTSSTIGTEGTERFSVYSASKAAVLPFLDRVEEVAKAAVVLACRGQQLRQRN